MPRNDLWTIHNNPSPNPPGGDRLNGLHILKTDTGYQLTKPNITEPLDTTNASEPPFNFNGVHYNQRTWNIHVKKLPPGGRGDGRWEIKPGAEPGGDPNDGEFTAQAGAGVAEDDPEAASSACA